MDEEEQRKIITACGSNYLSSEGIKTEKVSLSESSSESDPDTHSPSQKMFAIERNELPVSIPQPSCSCTSTCQDQINSLKDYLDRTMEIYHQSLSAKMCELGNQMVDLKAAIQQLLDRTTCNVNCDVNSDFENNWDFLPCRTKEEFENFDERIKEDQDFRQKLAQKFINIINKRATIVRNMGEILRFCLARDLALKFNPVKASEGKLFTFVNTNLYNIVKASLLSTISSPENHVSESDLIKVVSTVLHHCRDWEGGRVKRQKKAQQRDEDTTTLDKD